MTPPNDADRKPDAHGNHVRRDKHPDGIRHRRHRLISGHSNDARMKPTAPVAMTAPITYPAQSGIAAILADKRIDGALNGGGQSIYRCGHGVRLRDN